MSASRIGIDLGGTKMLLLSSTGEEIYVEKIPTGTNFTIADAESVIRRFVAKHARSRTSVGIAIPGLVDAGGRVIACDVLPQFEGWSPAVGLGLRVTTATLNDAEAALVEEAAGLDEGTTAAVVMVGTGIGAAFLVGGRMLRGASGWAGELGSIPFRINEGYRTLDAVASGDAIVKRIGAEFEVIAARARSGDEGVLQVFSECGAALGAGLASVINLFNPSLLALGGGTLRWPGYLSAAIESARSLSIPQLWDTCTVRESVHGEHLVALGAARAAAELEGTTDEA